MKHRKIANNKELQNEFLRLWPETKQISATCRKINICSSWFYKWRIDDEEFRAEFEKLRPDKTLEQRKERFIKLYEMNRSVERSINKCKENISTIAKWTMKDENFRKRYAELKIKAKEFRATNEVYRAEKTARIILQRKEKEDQIESKRIHKLHPQTKEPAFWPAVVNQFKKHVRDSMDCSVAIDAVSYLTDICKHKETRPIKDSDHFWCKYCGKLLLEKPGHLGFQYYTENPVIP